MHGQSREEVKVACCEGSARVNGTVDLRAVGHVQIWTKLQHDVGQVALDRDWHHPLEGASSGKTRNVDHEHNAISTTLLTSRWCRRRQCTRAGDGQDHAFSTARLVLMDLALHPSSYCL